MLYIVIGLLSLLFTLITFRLIGVDKLWLLICLIIYNNISPCKTYWIGGTSTEWTNANNFCLGVGTTLASIHSASDMAQAQSVCGGGCWIGLLRSGSSFYWTDGTSYTYTYWAPTEPSNSGGNENCVEIEPSSSGGGYTLKWNDQNCGEWNHALCNPIPTPPLSI